LGFLFLDMETFKYRELQKLLKSQIIEGVYKEGDLLPSENELSSAHDMTRTTVRQALQKMEDDGYITKKKGKGSIVNLKKKRLGLLSFKGFSEVITDQKVNNQIFEGPVARDWPEEFFYPLSGAEAEAGCIFLHRLRFINQSPIMLEYTYIPNTDLPGFTEIKLVNDSLFATLAMNFDIEITSMDQEVRAIKADEELAVQLEVGFGEPILHAYRKYGTSRKDLNIYSSLFFNTDSFAIGSYFQ
jgi:DNA-binding GntR family transcriptional regulator